MQLTGSEVKKLAEYMGYFVTGDGDIDSVNVTIEKSVVVDGFQVDKFAYCTDCKEEGGVVLKQRS